MTTSTKQTYRCYGCGNTFESNIVGASYNNPYCNSCIDRGAACEGCDDVKETILREAERLVGGDRNDAYGDYSIEARHIAQGWNILATAGNEWHVTPRLVPLLMIWLKLVRQAHRHKRDNLVDIAGYAHLAQQLNDKETPP